MTEKRILVIEDEPDIRDLTATVLRRAGYTVDDAGDGIAGLEIAKATIPDAIILDLMLPGLHGFEVIQHLQENETTRAIPIIVLSAKPYLADQRKALSMGAKRFILKPFQKEGFLASVRDEFERTKVNFWGVRGSIAAPGRDTSHYGGNTPCITVEHAEHVVICDAGTGIRRLGIALQRRARGAPLPVALLITHTHWDHIQGFPFFIPALIKGNTVSIYGPPSVERPLEKLLRGQMDPQHFPVALGDMAAKISVNELRGEPLTVGPFRISYGYVNHPGVTLAYRLEVGGRVIVYAPDNEPYRHLLSQKHPESNEGEEYARVRDRGLTNLLAGADLAVCDAQYTPEEYRQKMGWGHSNYLDTVDVCIEAGVKRLALFSHDPMHTDDMITEKLRRARAHADERGAQLHVLAAAEGQAVDLSPERPHARIEG